MSAKAPTDSTAMTDHNPTSNSSEKSAVHTMDEITAEYTEVVYGGEDKLPPPPILTPQEEKRLWRKIDMRIMPIATSLYLCSFLDRSNIGEHLDCARCSRALY